VHDQIRLLEELSANAWPPAVTQVLDGWLLRYASGVSRRANSVLALPGADAGDFEARLRVVEEFYRRRGLPARFHLSPAASPADLDQRLEERGYRFDCPTAVQTATLADIARRLPEGAEQRVELSRTPDEEWFRIYYTTHPWDVVDQEVRRGILARVGPRTAFATLRRNGEPVAVGQGVMERGWLGLFSMSTHPDHRRQGAATELVRALTAWGQKFGAESCYLQVMDESSAALELYRKLGFETLYHYHYREQS
jgi:GNAT superfamily N-acetyltransferase